MKRITFVLLLSLLSLGMMSCSPYCGQPGEWVGWGGMMHYGYGGMYMGIIILLFIIVVVFLVLREVSRQKRTEPDVKKAAMDILKERYAKGEITKEDFERMKEDIKD